MDKDNLSLKDAQDLVRKFVSERKWENPAEDVVLHMCEELGEIARATLKMKNYGGNHKNDDPSNMGEEISDMLYLLLKLSNTLKIDLAAEFLKKMDKNEKRFKAA